MIDSIKLLKRWALFPDHSWYWCIIWRNSYKPFLRHQTDGCTGPAAYTNLLRNLNDFYFKLKTHPSRCPSRSSVPLEVPALQIFWRDRTSGGREIGYETSEIHSVLILDMCKSESLKCPMPPTLRINLLKTTSSDKGCTKITRHEIINTPPSQWIFAQPRPQCCSICLDHLRGCFFGPLIEIIYAPDNTHSPWKHLQCHLRGKAEISTSDS